MVPDITKVKPLPIAGTLKRLYLHPAGSGCTILYSNGAVCSTTMEQLSDVVAEDKDSLLQRGEVIMESHLWSIETKNSYIVCLIQKGKVISQTLIEQHY